MTSKLTYAILGLALTSSACGHAPSPRSRNGSEPGRADSHDASEAVSDPGSDAPTSEHALRAPPRASSSTNECSVEGRWLRDDGSEDALFSYIVVWPVGERECVHHDGVVNALLLSDEGTEDGALRVTWRRPVGEARTGPPTPVRGAPASAASPECNFAFPPRDPSSNVFGSSDPDGYTCELDGCDALVCRYEGGGGQSFRLRRFPTKTAPSFQLALRDGTPPGTEVDASILTTRAATCRSELEALGLHPQAVVGNTVVVVAAVGQLLRATALDCVRYVELGSPLYPEEGRTELPVE